MPAIPAAVTRIRTNPAVISNLCSAVAGQERSMAARAVQVPVLRSLMAFPKSAASQQN